MSSVLPGRGGGGGGKGLKMLLLNCKEKWSSPSTSLFSTVKVQDVFKLLFFLAYIIITVMVKLTVDLPN